MAYARPSSLVLGYHGCDRSVAEGIFSGKLRHLRASANRYDWLGTGIYFWEGSAARALDYAKQRQTHPAKREEQIRKPAVIGAVIDLGNCLDLLDAQFFEVVRDGYEKLIRYVEAAGVLMPLNRVVNRGQQIQLRNLDCDVINTIHQSREEEGEPPFDTVRAAFVEGKELYPTASFFDRNHIQLCVRNTAVIKGYFRAIEE